MTAGLLRLPDVLAEDRTTLVPDVVKRRHHACEARTIVTIRGENIRVYYRYRSAEPAVSPRV